VDQSDGLAVLAFFLQVSGGKFCINLAHFLRRGNFGKSGCCSSPLSQVQTEFLEARKICGFHLQDRNTGFPGVYVTYSPSLSSLLIGNIELEDGWLCKLHIFIYTFGRNDF
jgi:hypothetical protein